MADANNEDADASQPQESAKSEEELRAEAMTQLKQLGNMLLRPFGLSTDSFEIAQQPGGSYSIQTKTTGSGGGGAGDGSGGPTDESSGDGKSG